MDAGVYGIRGAASRRRGTSRAGLLVVMAMLRWRRTCAAQEAAV